MRRGHDALYRQAREVYNRLADDGLGRWSGYKEREIPLAEVFDSFKQLAAVRYGKAYFPLSALYSGWQSIDGDSEKNDHYRKLAFDWLHANQHLNDPEVWHDLGALYVGNNVELAIHWFQKAADAGDASSMWGLTCAYEHLENWQEALYWQIEAAKAGHEEAQHGLKIQHDRGDLDIDDEQVFNWYVWSAEHGYVWAQLFLADAYRDGDALDKDDKQSMYWYRKAAEQGDRFAQVFLGMGYRDGRRIEQNDEQAVFWFRKAAEQGCSNGQVNLGFMYGNGRGVARNDEQAFYLTRKAAEQGCEVGQCNLGGMYQFGRGVEKDAYQGYLWLLKAAEQGYASGQYWLASAYEHGRGVDPDCEQANYWYRKAAAQGHVLAQAALKNKKINLYDRLKKLPPKEREKVLQLALVKRKLAKVRRMMQKISKETT